MRLAYFLYFLASGTALLAGVSAHTNEQPHLTVQSILNLRRDGVNTLAYSDETKEVFVSHPVEYGKLRQWNTETKKLVHTYSCPGGDARWDEIAVSPDGTLLVASTYPLGDPIR